MRTRTSLVLAALGAVVLTLGIVYGSGPVGETEQTLQGQLVFPDLTPKLADAAQVEIRHGTLTVHLARDPKQAHAPWSVTERGGYPAQQDKVHSLLVALTELRLDAARTADPAEYARLGVGNPGKGHDATLVRVLDAKGGVIAALILGHTRSAQRGSADTLYIRRPEAAQSWLADGKVLASGEALDWLDRKIVDIDAKRIAGVTATRGAATVAFARKNGAFTVVDPAEHPALDDYKVDQVSGALAGLELEDVQKAPAPGTPLGHTVFTTTDGLTLAVDVTKAGPAVWATFAVTGGKDAAPLEAKLKGWAYEIGSWKESALAPTLASVQAAAPAASAVPPGHPAHLHDPMTALPGSGGQ